MKLTMAARGDARNDRDAMRLLFLSLPIVAIVGACTSSSDNGPSVVVPGSGFDAGGTPPGAPPGTPPGTPPPPPPGGPDCAKDYEPIADTIKRYEGKWLVDDASTNASCPNGFYLDLAHIITKYDGIPPNDPDLSEIAPPDDIHQQANGCPPAAFFVEKRQSLKACSEQYCWDPKAGYGFYAHARPLVPNPNVPSYADFLLFHAPTGWQPFGTVDVEPNTPDAIDYNGHPFKRQVNPVIPDGTCTTQ
jgi:hypothetical protein